MNEIIDRLNAYYQSFLRVLPRIGIAIIVLVVGIIVVNWVGKGIRRKISSSSHDPLMSGFLSKAIKLVLFIALFMRA